jgi:hypothetical protein
MLNLAIGLQVVFGSIITALAALAGGKKLGVVLSVLGELVETLWKVYHAAQPCFSGGVQTALASYLAKNRGSNEPAASKARAKNLGNYLWDVEAFLLDHGHEPGIEHDDTVKKYRDRLGEIKNEGDKPSP